jgi:S1-C subfamily serine protease
MTDDTHPEAPSGRPGSDSHPGPRDAAQPAQPDPVRPDSVRDDAADWEDTHVYTAGPSRPEATRAGWDPGNPSWGSPAANRTSWPDDTRGAPGTTAAATGWSSAPVSTERVTETRTTRRASPFGQVVLAAVLGGILASGGTFLALNATGSLDRPTLTAAPVATSGTTVGARQPVTLDESSAIIDVAAKVSPAVVRITAEGSATNGIGNQIPQTGVGSGVIFDANGWILTNRHVVTNDSAQIANRLTVELKDGRRFDGRVYGVDTLTDLAIVKIDATGLPVAPIGDSSNLKVGQLAIAIGSPLGTYSNSVTSGIISAKGRSITVDSGQQLTNLIQTDAAINPGNSGGPLLDAAGNVIGINTAIAANSSGIGFAIPINIARPIMQQALAGQKLARPYIGIRYEAIDVQLATQDKLPVQHGAIIRAGQGSTGQGNEAVVPGSPADKAGLRENDIITNVDGQTIDTEHPLDAVLSQFAPGQTVSVTILRDGKEQKVSVTLGTRPPNLQ